MKVTKRLFAWVLAALAVFAIVIGAAGTAVAAVTDAPATQKQLIDNGDGTYTLTLSVTGATESSTTTEVTKANVILVLDTSSSMNQSSGTSTDYTYTPYNGTSNNPQKWGIDADGHYIEVYYRRGAWRTGNGNNSPVYNGTVYERSGGALSRLEAEKDALTKEGGIVDNLLAQNVPGDANKSDIIEVAVVNFATGGNVAQTFTTNGTTLKNTIDGLTTSTGTNWQEGLMRAEELADSIRQSQPDEDVYIIFLTDGEPTTHYNDYTVSTNYAAEWGYASGNARTLVTDGGIFYGLFTWGSSNSSHYLSSLVQYAYTGTGNSNTALAPAYQQYFTDASDTETLINALSQIVHDITTGVGYTNVELEDGVTSMTTSSVKATASGEVTGVKYYRSGGSYSTTANNGLGEEWADAPHATINDDGEVDWDLGDIVLENGVTYTIAFTVWPSQESLDLVADLNNGVVSYDSLTPDQKSQISVSGGHYSLKTNTDYPTVTYSTVTTTTVDGQTTTVVSDPQTATIVNPDPVGLAEERLNAKKEWEDSLDPSQREEVGESVTLYLMVDGDYYYVDEGGEPLGVVLTEESNWTETEYLAIAPGIMVTDESPAWPGEGVAGVTYVSWEGKNYAILETGHDYIWEESEINHHFELTAYTHHPMIMGTDSDGNPIINDVVFTYSGGAISGIESVEKMTDTLSATNTLKGGINITKKVVDEDGAEVEDLNPFTVTVTVTDPDGNALPTKTTEDGTSYTIDYRIYYGENNPAYETSGDKHRSDHIYVTGTSFEETLYVGDTIRVVNVEDDSVYTVEETAPTGYELVGVEYSIAYGTEDAEPVEEGEDATVQGNSASYAEVTNKLVSGSLQVSKVVEVESGDEEQAKAKEFEFTFKLYSDDTKAVELEGYKFPYTITDADGNETTGTIEEGGTFTLKDGESILIERLPETAYYEVTEDVLDGFESNFENDVASGTITKNATAEVEFENTYSVTPVIVDPPVKKDITGSEELYNGGDFTFTIANTAAPDGVTAPMPTNTSITNSATYELTDKPGYYEFGEIEFTEPGTYTYTVTESGSALGVTNDSEATKEITFTVTDKGDGTMTVSPATDEAVFTFTNTYKTGELDITKTVESDLAADANVKFTFTVTIKDAEGNLVEGNFPYAIGDTEGTIASGGTLELANGETAKITGIPDGATYEVTEEAVSGYTTTKTDDTGTISADATVTAAFTNTYGVTPVIVDPPVKKDITGTEDLYNGGDFTFTIASTKAPDGVTAPMPAKTEITNVAANERTDMPGYYEFGEITFTVPGEYTYTVTESGSALGVTNDSEATKTLTFTVTDKGDGTMTVSPATDEAVFTFTNEYKTGELDITKTVVNEINPNDTTKFTFTVTIKDAEGNPVEGSFPYAIGDTEGTIASGGTLQLANGETAKITGIPDGATYEVTEEAVSGYTTEKTGDTGTISAADSPATATFTNTYSVKAVELELSAGKKLEVEAPATNAPDVSGKYTLTLAATDGAPLPEGATDGKVEITNADGNGTMTGFGKISFTAPGEYQYTVSESGSVPGVANGTESYTVKVKVSDNGDGTLKAEVISGSQETLFTNTYKVTPVEIEKGFEVTKQLEGAPLAGGAFTFKLTKGTNDADVETPMPASDTVTNNDEGKATFGTITYNKPGTYNYTITEVNGGTTANGYTYDGHTVNVKVVVTDNGDGTLKAEVSYEGSTTFVNAYEASGDVRLTVSKTLNGATLSEGQFTFELVDEGGKVIQTKTNDASGAVTFDPITYDNSIFDEDATTVDGGTGEAPNDEAIEAETTEPAVDDAQAAPAADEPEAEATFADTLGEPEATEPEATEPAATEPEATEPEATETEPAADEPNLLADLAEFLGLNRLFTPTVAYAADSKRSTTVTYTIREVNDDKPGYTYDDHEVTVTVTVTDNGDGTLSAVPAYEGSTTFVNTYAANGSTVLEGTKSVTGTELKDGQFSFQLKDSTGKVIETVTNAADGSFKFSELKFTEADAGKTYEYTINEVNDGQAGYTYDSHTCTVSIKVTDNGDGTLTVTPTYSGGATFTNPYKPLATSAPFTATKQLTGKTLAAGMFTFELKDANGKVVATATNKADGTVDFGSIEFTEEGTYTYTATEVKGTDKNMTYDGSTKTYTVTVTDDNGQLKAEVSCSDSTFKNTYTPPEEPPVPPVIPETGDATPLVGMGAFAAAGAAAILGALRLRRRED